MNTLKMVNLNDFFNLLETLKVTQKKRKNNKDQ